jgi:hypothetical protein
MDLGSYAAYPLPPIVRTAFGVQTAQELADSLGATGTLTPDAVHDAERAYEAYRAGDIGVARGFLVTRAGLSEEAADAALARLAAA